MSCDSRDDCNGLIIIELVKFGEPTIQSHGLFGVYRLARRPIRSCADDYREFTTLGKGMSPNDWLNDHLLEALCQLSG